MNAKTRSEIAKIVEQLQTAFIALDDINSQLEELHENEQEKFDNLSEGL